MLVPLLSGLLAAMSAVLLWLLRKRIERSDLEVLALAALLAFIDAFMLAYVAPFYPAFASKLTFHVFAYTLLASLTAVLYCSYRASKDVRAYAVAMAPWFLILALIVVSRILGSRVVFLW